MDDTETELTSSEPDVLGADFITVELDTQPIEYVVKWAEVGSKFTISCVKKDSDEGACFTSDQFVKVDPDERYEAVYTECEDIDPSLIASQEVVRSDVYVDDHMELVNHQLGDEEEDSSSSSSSSSDDDDEDDDMEEDEGSDGDCEGRGSISRDKRFNCQLCDKSYSHSSSLARHLHVHATGGSPKPRLGESQNLLQCNVCGAQCNGKRLLAIHKKSHKSKRHTCDTCGKNFSHSSSLSRHKLIHRRALDQKLKPLYQAPTPAPVVTGTQRRRVPKKKKVPVPAENKFVAGEREKQYQCTQCDMVFNTSTSLSKHQVSHVRQLLNSYAQGKDALDKSSDLKIRLKLCSRDKPNYYTLCKKNKRGKGGRKGLPLTLPPDDDCEGSFSHTGDLDVDEHTHGNEKLYGCNSCKKTFVRMSNLKQHQQTHAMGKMYECQHCGKTFVHSSSFSRHKKVHAGLNQVPNYCGQDETLDETAPLEFDSE